MNPMPRQALVRRSFVARSLLLAPVWLLAGCSADSGTAAQTPSTSTTTPTPSVTAPVTPPPSGEPSNPATPPPAGTPSASNPAPPPAPPVTPNPTPNPSTTTPVESDDSTPPVDTSAGEVTSETGESSSPPATTGEPTVNAGAFEVNVQLASDVDDKAPTTVGIVTWTTTGTMTDAHVEFGLTTDYGMQAPVDLAAEDHRTLLLGMKPDSVYHFRVVTSDGTNSIASDDYTVETGPATTAVGIGSFEVVDEAAREPGFIVASYWSGTGSSVAYILDPDGIIVWAYDTGIAGGIARARISDDGKDMWVITASNSGNTLRRVGIDGLGAQTYDAAVGSHDITPVSGSKMAFLEYGESDCNSIFEIDPSGQTKEIWDSQDLRSGGGGGGSMCHGNAVRFSAAEGVYTFSDVSTDIVQVTPEGELQWKLTEKVPTGNAAWGGVQHGHHLLASSLVIFSNKGSKSHSGASAAIEYDLESGAELWRYEGADGETSANLGDVQRLPGGNTLVTFSNDSIAHEVTPDKKVVMKWTGTANTRIGYAEWRPSIYGTSPFLHD